MKPERITFASGAVALVADRYGDSTDPPVVFLHGGGQTRHSWGRAATVGAEAGWWAITIDLRGHGESTWDPTGAYGLDDYAGDLVAVFDQLECEPVVVGASLGGLAAIRAMGGLRPGSGRGLVLVDIVPAMERAGTERIGDFLRAHVQTGFGSLEEAAEAVAAYAPRAERSIDPAGLRKNLRERDGRWYWHWDPAFLMSDPDRDPAEIFDPAMLTDCVRRIAVPKLLVRGRMSDVVSEEGARRFLAEVPEVGYVDVADAAHMVAGDKNDVFRNAVIEFLAGLS
jgi:pimeloyl-ACP methyl ester carboxylesterase